MHYTGFAASQQGRFNPVLVRQLSKQLSYLGYVDNLNMQQFRTAESKSEKGRLPHISAYRSFGLDVAVIEGGRACRIIQAKCRTDYSILTFRYVLSSLRH